MYSEYTVLQTMDSIHTIRKFNCACLCVRSPDQHISALDAMAGFIYPYRVALEISTFHERRKYIFWGENILPRFLEKY